ncbi:MAG: 3'-5' exonuclease [Roseibium sp.]|nr:3'-5' exonuclease [Roseibium sp.]
MLIGGSDIETTGLKTGDHRIIEVYHAVWDFHKRVKVDSFHELIDPQRSIPADSTRIHNLTAADLAGKRTWDDVAPEFLKSLNSVEQVVFHNGQGFDGPFIDYELKRIGLPPSNMSIIDTFLLGRWATPDGKAPSLKELCRACEVDYQPSEAHRADYDTDKMMSCFFKAVDWGFIDVGTDIAA